MLRSKHSGWTWEGKRTPFGGGNPISAITDPISSALGTDGGGGGLLGGLGTWLGGFRNRVAKQRGPENLGIERLFGGLGSGLEIKFEKV